MLHEIKITFNTQDGKIAVDTGDLPTDQALGLMNTARKHIRKQEGTLEVLVTKDVKTQVVTSEFQADEILQWSELLGMLAQASEDAKFKQRLMMTMMAQQRMAAQAQASMQQQGIAQQVARQRAVPGGNIILGG